MHKTLLTAIARAAFVATLLTTPLVAQATTQQEVVAHYATIVHANYADAYHDAVTLQRAIDALLAVPNADNMHKAKQAWLTSRDSYGQTEAFRFYEGPIDFVDDKKGIEGPEGRLNAWPLNEAYIDYVQGNATAGIVQNGDVAITKDSLTSRNQETDEADVSTGYHAIEFLLWGQDLSLESAGQRPVADYNNIPENQRRREYLKAVTALLVDDMRFLKTSWEANQDNYAARFVKGEHSLAHMMTALATLSGFELASERMATALDSGDQEDEHSCFSDNTHNDFIMNAKGISNVFLGEYGDIKGASIYALLKEKDATMADALKAHIMQTATLIDAIPFPIDREVLATPKDSAARAKMELAIASLQKQADLLRAAGKTLDIDVQINE